MPFILTETFGPHTSCSGKILASHSKIKLEMLLETGTLFYVKTQLLFFMSKMLDCLNKL